MDVNQRRINMVQNQVRTWNVLDEKILSLMTNCQREIFVPDSYQDFAYADMQIPLGYDQVMLEPMVVGRILNSLSLSGKERVLEIGTGSGYMTALLAQLAHHVTSIEIVKSLAIRAASKLSSLNIHNIEIIYGNAMQVLQSSKAFDVVVITGSVLYPPKLLINQTTIKGRLFAIVGRQPVMQACLFTRIKEDEWTKSTLFETVAPPLKEMQNACTFEF